MFFKITGWNMLTLWLAIYKCHIKNHVKQSGGMFFASPKSSKTSETCNVFSCVVKHYIKNAKCNANMFACLFSISRTNCFTSCTWKRNCESSNAIRIFALETSISKNARMHYARFADFKLIGLCRVRDCARAQKESMFLNWITLQILERVWIKVSMATLPLLLSACSTGTEREPTGVDFTKWSGRSKTTQQLGWEYWDNASISCFVAAWLASKVPNLC